MFVVKEKMKKTDIKKNFRQVLYTTQYSLTPDQHNNLVKEKLERALRQSQILKANQAKFAKNWIEDRI